MSCVYRRSALLLFLASFARAGHEFPARPGEEIAPQQLIVKLKQGVSPASIIPAYLPGAVIEPLRHADMYLVYVPSGTSSSASSQLAAHFLVEFTEPNRVRHSTLQSPNDPQVASQWALSAVQAQQAWLLIPDQYLTSALAGNGASRIKVAILDSGIDCTHPDFANSGGISDDAAQGGQILFSASKAPVPTSVSPATCAFQDDYGHGTHVAGIVAAATQNATGIASLGFPLELVAYKVLGKDGSGLDTVIANAIIDAVASGAQIISLSLGAPGYSQTLQLAVNYAWAHNSIVVAAAGNNASRAVFSPPPDPEANLFYPADANFAVGVSATDSNGNLASFSNFGDGISIAAPGVSILSTLPTYTNTLGTQNYGYLSGTSMATPHVSALAGLVSMTTPNASAAAILERIQQSAASTIVNGGWNQNFGYGIINAYNAVSGTLRPASLGSLVGQIVDANANPVNGATIVVNGQSRTTGSSGLYRFVTLAAGSYSVSVTAAGFPTQNLSAVITPGADTKLQVIIGVTYGKFTGAVTDSGSPVAGAVVEALSGGVIVATAFTDINGQYSLWVASGGTYDLSVSAISKTTTTATAQSVAAAATSTVNLTMAKLGIISGAVRNASLQAVSNAQIFLSGASSTWGAVSDANGNYSSIGLPVGPYTMTCSASGLP
jgi:thermitase